MDMDRNGIAKIGKGERGREERVRGQTDTVMASRCHD